MSDEAVRREIRELRHAIAALHKDVRAILRAVDPNYSGEPERTTRKRDPRALYGDNH